MITIKSIEELEKCCMEHTIAPFIEDYILADLMVMKTHLSPDYYDINQIDKYGPMVVVMSRKEFKKIDELIPTIKPSAFEYKEIVAVNHKHYANKLLYLFNNGESGIIVYVIHDFKDNARFENDIYVTSNAAKKLPDILIRRIIKMAKIAKIETRGKLDYLQVFEITNIGKSGELCIHVNHRQEQPNYSQDYYMPDIKVDDCKIFWISSYDEKGNEYSTIMLAEDY